MERIANKGVLFAVLAFFFACTTSALLFVLDGNEVLISDLQSELKDKNQVIQSEDLSALKDWNTILVSNGAFEYQMALKALNKVEDFQKAAEKVLLPYVVEEINYEAQKLSNQRDCLEARSNAQCQAEADAYTLDDYRKWRDMPFKVPLPEPPLFNAFYEAQLMDSRQEIPSP